METYTPLTYIDDQPDENGRFQRVIYRRDPDNPHLPDVDNGYVTSIEMIDDDGVRVDYENLENDPRDYIDILLQLLKGDYNE
jgi:hypothetical protein